jgi:hypothetical protein
MPVEVVTAEYSFLISNKFSISNYKIKLHVVIKMESLSPMSPVTPVEPKYTQKTRAYLLS